MGIITRLYISFLRHVKLIMFLFCLVFAVFCARLFVCALWSPAGGGGGGGAGLLALVCGVFCEFVTFSLVSWVRCGT